MRTVLLAGVVLVLAAGIFWPEAPPDPFPHSDKLGHCLGFLALALSARLAWAPMPAAALWGGLLVAAPLLEWLQHWVSPARQRSLGDALANLAGVLLALALWRLWAYWRAGRKAAPPS